MIAHHGIRVTHSWTMAAHSMVCVRCGDMASVAGHCVAAHVTDDSVVSLSHHSLLLRLQWRSGGNLGATLGARTLHLGYQPWLDRGVVMVVVMMVMMWLLWLWLLLLLWLLKRLMMGLLLLGLLVQITSVSPVSTNGRGTETKIKIYLFRSEIS